MKAFPHLVIYSVKVSRFSLWIFDCIAVPHSVYPVIGNILQCVSSLIGYSQCCYEKFHSGGYMFSFLWVLCIRVEFPGLLVTHPFLKAAEQCQRRRCSLHFYYRWLTALTPRCWSVLPVCHSDCTSCTRGVEFHFLNDQHGWASLPVRISHL